jgi:tRNA(Arg) A34 adenosine deaminase TadA
MNTILTNGPVSARQLENAAHILLSLQQELRTYIAQGAGPFLAAIYDEKGNLISKTANSVVAQNCSHCHAEMNAIKQAEEKLHTFDLAPHRLRLYVTSEPCLMCLGGILWSGIREVYFGVPSKRVEEITGFDEGFKPDWFNEFKKRGITVYGQIEQGAGEQVLQDYVTQGHIIYEPKRNYFARATRAIHKFIKCKICRRSGRN